jgi:cyclophilin family peptidyl-prolyl cis-trans isomerase
VPSDKRQRQREGRVARQEELRRAQQAAKKKRQIIIGVVAVVVAGAIFFLVTKGGGKSKSVSTNGATTTLPGSSTTVNRSSSTTTPRPTTTIEGVVPIIDAPAGVACPAADGSSPHYTMFTAAPPNCIDATKIYTATLQTDAGDITIKLDPVAAPKTVNNFVFLIGYHFYDGTIFHRVIPGFVDQGGDPMGTGAGNPGYQFADELPKSASLYVAGSLAMANSGPNTNGSQFFIVVGTGGSQLQPSYSLFGQVTGGMDVVTTINNDGAASGTPTKVHKIVKATVAVS